MISLFLALLNPAVAPAAPAESLPLRLVCVGIGEAWWEDFENQALLEIASGTARVKPPERILPPARGGDSFGWWNIRNLKITEDEVRGNVRMNLINKPSIRLDRRTNELTFKGSAGSFRGKCQPQAADPNAPLSVADELSKLAKLRDAGVITEEEFNAQKAKLLGQP